LRHHAWAAPRLSRLPRLQLDDASFCTYRHRPRWLSAQRVQRARGRPNFADWRSSVHVSFRALHRI